MSLQESSYFKMRLLYSTITPKNQWWFLNKHNGSLLSSKISQCLVFPNRLIHKVYLSKLRSNKFIFWGAYFCNNNLLVRIMVFGAYKYTLTNTSDGSAFTDLVIFLENVSPLLGIFFWRIAQTKESFEVLAFFYDSYKRNAPLSKRWPKSLMTFSLST